MMVNGNPQLDDLSADSLPVPVCRFTFEDGEPVVCGTNQPFDDQLVAVEQGDSLATVFSYLNGPADEELRAALRNGEQFTAAVSPVDGLTARYLVDVTPPNGSTAGCLLFTDVTRISETDGSDPFKRGSSNTDSTDQDPFQQGLAVDHVASVVSHDLRNPLDVARARLEAAREFDEDEHFEHVEQAHERMERIIQDVLTLARGEDVVDPDETVDLGAVAERAWETVETNGGTLTVEDELPTAQADSDRVSRLFENLFRNAVEHGSTSSRTDSDNAVEHGSTSPASQAQQDSEARNASGSRTQSDDGVEHGGDDVTVRVGPLDDGLYVADDGPGIPEDNREKVVEPGYSSHEHGTGLGLAIVARIADLHGWCLDVTESTAGGAQFEIRGVDQQ